MIFRSPTVSGCQAVLSGFELLLLACLKALSRDPWDGYTGPFRHLLEIARIKALCFLSFFSEVPLFIYTRFRILLHVSSV